MTQVAEKPTSFVQALEKRPLGGPRWLDDLRARGAAKFTALGIPTVRDEARSLWQEAKELHLIFCAILRKT